MNKINSNTSNSIKRDIDASNITKNIDEIKRRREAEQNEKFELETNSEIRNNNNDNMINRVKEIDEVDLDAERTFKDSETIRSELKRDTTLNISKEGKNAYEIANEMNEYEKKYSDSMAMEDKKSIQKKIDNEESVGEKMYDEIVEKHEENKEYEEEQLEDLSDETDAELKQYLNLGKITKSEYEDEMQRRSELRGEEE